MRYIITFFFTFLGIVSAAQPTKSDKEATKVFQKLSNKLSGFETISYRYYRSINYLSENYRSETEGNTFLDFRIKDTALGFRYLAENKDYKSVYNGAETFYLNKVDTTIKISFKAQRGHVESLPLFANSIVTLKKALPQIIADNEVPKMLTDTIIENEKYYLASFILQNKTLSYLGEYSPITLERKFQYKIIIDKTTFLPLHIIQTNNAEPRDYMRTTFSDIKADISQLPETSWYYSTYLKDFKLSSDKKLTLIKENTMAPDWQAVYFNTNDNISLGKLKGNVVLLEFWIKNCGYCIAAVPELNSLIEKYKTINLSVIGINRHDKQEDVKFFYQKNRPNFNTVFDINGSITTAYGVDGFPTLVLIDKKGKVLYAGGLDIEVLNGLLKAALE